VHQVIGVCPVCSEKLTVTRLHCRNCDTAIEGQFTLGRFHDLTPEQLAFAETFIRCEGKITKVEDELGISYPTVRSRLSDLIRALGYPVSEEPEAPITPEQRKHILDQLAQGKISADTAVKLLEGRQPK